LAELFMNYQNLGPWDVTLNLDIPPSFQQVVVSLSGGADSTALFHLLWESAKRSKRVELAVLHVAYGLRGEESDADFRHCEALAHAAGVPFHARVVTEAERSARAGESLQAWARRLRREAYASWAGAGWVIALAHHRDDAAETVLMRLARGAAPAHLAGLKAYDPPLWRPLVGATRAEIREYLEENGLSWREDSSNAGTDYARNSLRHEVLPRLEALWPGAAERLTAAADEAADLASAVDAWIAAQLRGDATLARIVHEARDSAPGLARHAVAAAARGLLGRSLRLSRQILDDLVAAASAACGSHQGGPKAAVTLEGGRLLSWAHGKLVILPAEPKAHRRAQHRRALEPLRPDLVLEAGASLREG
jgi:tRNA(Ile)-lysidine synthase